MKYEHFSEQLQPYLEQIGTDVRMGDTVLDKKGRVWTVLGTGSSGLDCEDWLIHLQADDTKGLVWNAPSFYTLLGRKDPIPAPPPLYELTPTLYYWSGKGVPYRVGDVTGDARNDASMKARRGELDIYLDPEGHQQVVAK